MFRKRKIVGKNRRLVAIFDLVADGNLWIDAQSGKAIIDYLYDYYDGIDRFKFPAKRIDLEFCRPPHLLYPGDKKAPVNSGDLPFAMNLGLYSAKGTFGKFYINIFTNGSFGTFVWDDGDWKITPGLDD